MPYFIEPPANLFPEAPDQLGHIRANVFVQTASVILAPGWIVLMMLHDASHFQEPKSRIVHFRFSVKNRDFLEACFIETQELQGIHPTKKTKRHPPGNSAGDLSFWDGECMSISSDFSWPPRKTKGMFYSSSHLYSPETHQWDLKMLLLASSGSFVAVTWTKLMFMCHCGCLRRIKNHAKVLRFSTFSPGQVHLRYINIRQKVL